MDIAQAGIAQSIRPQRGQAVFVPANAWDKPQWSRPTRVLTFLFGAEHIGISLVERKGGAETKVQAIKTNIHGAYDALTHSILGALIVYASERSQGPLGNLLVESLLQACLRLLKTPAAQHSRKAVRTFELICLYVQENFQSSLYPGKYRQTFWSGAESRIAFVPAARPSALHRLFESCPHEPGQVHVA